MDATTAFAKVGGAESAGSSGAPDRATVRGAAEAKDPFQDVLEGASQAREAAERTERKEVEPRQREEIRRKDTEDDADVETTEGHDDEDEKDRNSRKVQEDRQPAELVVNGGINLVVSQTSGGDETEAEASQAAAALVAAAQADGDGAETVPTGNAMSEETKAKLAEAQAKADAQAKAGAAQVQAIGVEGKGEDGETAEQTGTPDRGAEARAALERLGAGAKGESTHRQKPTSEGSAGSDAKAAASENVEAIDRLIQSVKGTAEKPAEAGQVQGQAQIQSHGGAERSEAVQAASGLGKVDVKAEGLRGGEASQTEQAGEPAVDRQKLMDQVVRSARLHLERGTSRFEMRLDPPSLGRLKVVMDLKDGSLNISFRAESHAVKDALQNSLPQLREALAGQGLSLDGFDVQSSGHGAHEQGDARQGQGFGDGGAEGSRPHSTETVPSSTTATEAVRAGNGLVDCWA